MTKSVLKFISATVKLLKVNFEVLTRDYFDYHGY